MEELLRNALIEHAQEAGAEPLLIQTLQTMSQDDLRQVYADLILANAA